MTEEQRAPGQVVNLSSAEHMRSAFWVIVASLMIGGIFSMNQVWSQTAVNTKDIARHEGNISVIVNTLDRIETKVDTLIGQIDNGRQ